MEPLSEREAIHAFLGHFAMLADLDRKLCRIERVTIGVLSILTVVNVILASLGGFQALDMISYAAACWAALSVRHWILRAVERRRQWQMMQYVAAEARNRLAILDRRNA